MTRRKPFVVPYGTTKGWGCRLSWLAAGAALLLFAFGCGRVGYEVRVSRSDSGVGDGAVAVTDAAAVTGGIAFVTSETVIPFETDRSEANAHCAVAAARGGWSGTFLAWFARDGRADVGLTGGWVRPDGLPVALSLEALQQERMLHPIALDEFGEDHRRSGIPVATAARQSGEAFLDCDGFTNPAGTISAGRSGSVGLFAFAGELDGCDEPAALYCFQTDASTITFDPRPGRTLFLSRSLFATDAGVAAMDAACQSEAASAGFSGRYAALIATPSMAAITRFLPLSEDVVRPDGVRVATAPDFTEGDVVAPLDVFADGEQMTGFRTAWVGAQSLGMLGDEQSCLGWTVADGSEEANFGSPHDTIQFFAEQGQAVACNGAGGGNHVYCFELP